MKVVITLFLSCLLLTSKAQSRKDSIRTIAENLVNASAMAFANYNFDQQFALVSEDAMLILTDLSKIENKLGYYSIIKRMGDNLKSRGVTRGIQFRYHTFSINESLVYAEGIFKVTFVSDKDRTTRNQYSAFKHVYRLEKKQWKLLVDHHTTNPGLTEDDFLKAKALEELN